MGCHASKEAANDQMSALYAQEGGKSMLHKRANIVESKADAESGTFEATVAIFNNIDHGGDRILPGAFAKTLERWRASGDPIPVIFNHDWADANAHIGVADPNEVVETDKGLFVKAYLDVNDNPVAAQVYKLLKRRSIKEMSFGYAVNKGGQKRADDGANELSDLDLIEVGPTLKGMNPATELHAVKSALGVEKSEDELRQQSQAVERELQADGLPESPPEPEKKTDEAVADWVKAIEALKEEIATLKAEPQKSEEQLRRETESAIREQVKKQLPAVKVPDGDELLTIDEARERLVGEVKEALVSEIKAELAEMAEKPTEEALRKASEELERERVAGNLPEGKAEVKREPDPAVAALEQKLGIVVGRLDELQKTLQDQQAKQAEVTGKETAEPTRSVDPLRRRSERAVLEIQSDGISERKPPTVKREPEPDPAVERALRKRSRQVMLELLTGVGNDTE